MFNLKKKILKSLFLFNATYKSFATQAVYV